jgi:hypothetical protein
VLFESVQKRYLESIVVRHPLLVLLLWAGLLLALLCFRLLALLLEPRYQLLLLSLS